MRINVLLAALLLIIAVGIYAYREYNRKNEDLSNLKASEKITAINLVKAYNENEDEANKKYIGKVIDVDGLVAEIQNDGDTSLTIALGDTNSISKVLCLLDSKHLQQAKEYKAGMPILIRGYCTGFLMDVQMNRCVIIKK